ncbi:rod shape-determining protein MreD [Candidatus Aerophobetes bacterium]|jgi:rod shape-determining protein MreD|uniref:Rod shape-determining protein MreD n=1 Tax=Aerophobetes bacterium TaxID=2030807 RepID=A0A523ZG18_UNCAE|nr:MAG: rod shape-determining protein MreD [Candidatus Aerophobetes bacterium]TEU02736.1 MAG: rod shape-determining protein MreD [Candidatus Aerophobetes bacterium]
MKKTVIFIFLVILVLILQGVLIGRIQLRWGRPDLPLILLIFWAWHNNWKQGLIAGFVIGLLVDILFFPLLGLNAFSLALVGFLVAEIRERVYQDNVIFFILLIGAATVLNGIILSFWLLVFNISPSFLEKIVFIVFPTLLYNCIISFPIFLLREIFWPKSFYLERK